MRGSKKDVGKGLGLGGILALGQDIIEDRAKDLTERLVAWVMGGRDRGTGRARG